MPGGFVQLRLSFENEPVEVGEESEKIGEFRCSWILLDAIASGPVQKHCKFENSLPTFVYYFPDVSS